MTETDLSSTVRPFVTGPRVVAAMFGMGILATAFLYGYWTLHLMPFMPLQKAIVAEFPGSSPRVNGGQQKMHKETPRILHIDMKSEKDPTADDPETVAYMSSLRNRIVKLVDSKVDFPDLECIELHIYKLLPEKEILERSYRFDVTENSAWTEMGADGIPVTSESAPASGTQPATRVDATSSAGGESSP